MGFLCAGPCVYVCSAVLNLRVPLAMNTVVMEGPHASGHVRALLLVSHELNGGFESKWGFLCAGPCVYV